MQTNKVLHSLRDGQVQYGCSFSSIVSPEVPRLLAAAGFQWTYIDAEHGPFTIESVNTLCRSAREADLCPVVRVADLQYSLVARALDNGAMGILFPRVESPELLETAISWTKYPPRGVRGFGLSPLHVGVGFEDPSIPGIIEHMNHQTMVVMQIETNRAVNIQNELLAVDGVDIVMVGPADLSVSLGVPGEFFHPRLVEAIESIRDACLARGIVPGIQCRALDLAKFWKEKGMLFLGCGSETGFLLNGAKSVIQGLA